MPIFTTGTQRFMEEERARAAQKFSEERQLEAERLTRNSDKRAADAQTRAIEAANKAEERATVEDQRKAELHSIALKAARQQQSAADLELSDAIIAHGRNFATWTGMFSAVDPASGLKKGTPLPISENELELFLPQNEVANYNKPGVTATSTFDSKGNYTGFTIKTPEGQFYQVNANDPTLVDNMKQGSGRLIERGSTLDKNGNVNFWTQDSRTGEMMATNTGQAATSTAERPETKQEIAKRAEAQAKSDLLQFYAQLPPDIRKAVNERTAGTDKEPTIYQMLDSIDAALVKAPLGSPEAETLDKLRTALLAIDTKRAKAITGGKTDGLNIVINN